MRYILICIFFTISVFSSSLENSELKYVVNIIPKNMTVAAKKERFYSLLVPAVQKSHKKLMDEYERALKNIKTKTNLKQIIALKELYRVQSDEELLLALKPHPISIVLAQAAMESAWGTSRFFTQANNVFGVWSVNKNEPRIAANEKRKGNKTIWLRKFDTIEESISKYYKLLATSRAYKEFRELRYTSNDVYEMVKKLHRYSEMGELYAAELSKVIRYNNLTSYDIANSSKKRVKNSASDTISNSK